MLAPIGSGKMPGRFFYKVVRRQGIWHVIERIASDGFWQKIEKEFGSGGGIYILSCLDKDEAIIPISRFLGEDTEGILYIGMASCFLDRAIDLKKSLSPAHSSRAHECGVRHKSHEAISLHFPYHQLVLKLVGFANPRMAEIEALQAYVKKYGELPPLNRAG